MEERAFLHEALIRLGLWQGEEPPGHEALAGGVSSDIWRIDLPDGPVCIKRALAKLRVEMDWRAPVERNAYEVAWMEAARAIEPHAAPEILAHDAEAGLFAMPYLDPARYLLWKEELRQGRADPATAAEVGRRIGHIHAATAGREEIARRFPTDEIFHAIRLEPYLEATAVRHPDLQEILFGLSRRTAREKRALVHGDVSPKNILIGPKGPVFLDAECAWYGDPVFDIAFCLNHMLLKSLWNRKARPLFHECFGALASAWLKQVNWEDRDAAEARAASLLPGLFLGRVDGKSPVEYITAEADKDRVRRVARGLLLDPADRLEAVLDAWKKELSREQ
jgi:aminoglycoside phosphotransferase (APT) family kinase protein